jgi:hypothetical protein
MVDSFSNNALWNSYNTLLLSPDIDRIRKLLVRYELFNMTLDVPGDIVECGVFKGAGWMYWLKLLKLYAHGEQKRVIGFDTFGAFADSLLDYERESAKAFTTESEFDGVRPEEILALANQAGLNNAELIAGDVIQTLPNYIKVNQGFRISLLNLDFDTYHGTKVALENLYDLVTPGGIIVLDEYGKRGWGESDAVDEFFKRKAVEIKAVRGSFQPTAYIRKPIG